MHTILIVDDHAGFRHQARTLLEADGFVVIGEADDGATGLAAARTLRPDLVLLDIGLPDIEGFDVARELAADDPQPLVVLTSSRDASAFGPRLTAERVLGLHPEGRAVRPDAARHARRVVTLRLVLADDSVLLREGIARLLVEAGFDVAAQVGTADELLSAVREHRPDVAVVDIRMPPTHTDEGLRAAEAIRAEHGTTVGILVLSQYVETTFAMRLVADGAGGVGYLLKDRVEDLDDFSDAIRRIARGGSVIDPEVVAQLVGRRRARVPLDDLTEREREVLALMAEGRSNQAICDAPVPRAEDGRGAHRQHLLEARVAARPGRPSAGVGRARAPARLTVLGLCRRRRNPGATFTNDVDPRPAASVIPRGQRARKPRGTGHVDVAGAKASPHVIRPRCHSARTFDDARTIRSSS